MASYDPTDHQAAVKRQIKLAMEALNKLLTQDQTLPELEAGIAAAASQLGTAEVMAHRAEQARLKSVSDQTLAGGEKPSATILAFPKKVAPND
jgi:multidrug resistance efflux pump